MKAFVPMLARYAGIDDQELLEKDVRLHVLLDALTTDERLGEHLVFKGGTCLIKCYLHYPRFSTDLDFTWRHPEGWEGLGTKALRRELREVQRPLVPVLLEHAKAHGLTFDPGSPKDVQHAQSNRMLTVVLHHETLGGLPSIIKLQFNFLEPLLYTTQPRDAKSLLADGVPAELAVLGSDLSEMYARPVTVQAYDPREILAEKGRAILTRQATKVRDILDLFLIEHELGHRVEDHEDDILAKTRAAVDRADRYRDQLDLVDRRFQGLLEADVGPLLLKQVDEPEFGAHRRHVVDVLDRVAERLKAE